MTASSGVLPRDEPRRRPRTRSQALRAAAVAALATAYAGAFPFLFAALGPDVAGLFVLAVLPASLAYGLAGGIVAGTLALPLNVVLLRHLGPSAVAALGADWAGAVTGVAAGVAMGAARDVLLRVWSRAATLERERERLQGLIARRERAARERRALAAAAAVPPGGAPAPSPPAAAAEERGPRGPLAPVALLVAALRPVSRPLAVAALAFGYVAAFPVLFAALGPDVAALFVLAVLPSGLAYGLAGGVAAGALAVPLHLVLLRAAGTHGVAALSSDWAGAVTGLAVGVAGGAARDLLRRVRSQAEGLEGERARLEDEIVERERMERELEQTNAELVRARQVAERAATAKGVLLGRASHELRTPVAAILGYVELLQEELAAGAASSLQSDLRRVHSAASHLASLLDDLLDITRLESGRFAPRSERFVVAELLQEVAAIAAPLAARRGNRIELELAEAGVVLTSDRKRVEQIALNLLANAAKYTGNGTIRLAARAPCPATVELSVSDDGVGMTPEQAAHAFDEFYRADPTGSEGSGLGLPICRHLCRALGGTIGVRTAPGAGATFTVTLPAEPPRREGAAVPAS